MDYEKKYNEALEQAKGYMDAGSSDLTDVLPEIFPKLRESEDERIRKDIIGGLMWQRDNLKSEGLHDNNLILPGFCLTVGEHLKYLEKHKEQKQTDLPAGFYYIDLNGNRYYSKEFRYGDMKLKVGEQKPVESIEDSVKFEEGFKVGRESGLRDGQKYVLNNLDSYGLCKLAWSEEDELMRERCIADLGYLMAYEPQYKERYDAQIKWLKSLSEKIK